MNNVQIRSDGSLHIVKDWYHIVIGPRHVAMVHSYTDPDTNVTTLKLTYFKPTDEFTTELELNSRSFSPTLLTKLIDEYGITY